MSYEDVVGMRDEKKYEDVEQENITYITNYETAEDS